MEKLSELSLEVSLPSVNALFAGYKDSHHGPLESLPEELSVQVVSYLTIIDLLSLTRTCRILHNTATHKMYQNIRVHSHVTGDRTNSYSLGILFAVLRYLRPYLRYMVKCLDVKLSDNLRGVRRCSECCFENLPRCIWKIEMSLVLGELLIYMPNLEELSVNSMDVSPRLGYWDSREHLFDRNSSPDDFIPSKVPGFRNLTSLTWRCRDLLAAIACIPTLKSLALGADCMVPVFDDWPASPSITSLYIERQTTILPDEHSSMPIGSVFAHENFFAFIHRSTLLQELEIAFRNSNRESPIY